MKSVMQHAFSMIPSADIQRSVFDRSHGYKTTFDSGYLIPFYADEALPGDTFTCKTSILARLSTPIVPIMDNLFLDTFYFAVPIRLLWENWEKFNGAQDTPESSTDFLTPIITAPTGGFTSLSLYDYLGVPTLVDSFSISAFWCRAYNLIYNEWFRDQNLQDKVTINKGNGPDSYSNYNLLKRGKRHDYFTSCLPWPQKGDAVEIPLGVSAPVWGDGNTVQFGHDTASSDRWGGLASFNAADLSWTHDAWGVAAGTTVSPSTMQYDKSLGLLTKTVAAGYPGITSGIYADLSEATAYTINSLRQAFQIQKLLERDARGGTRYAEIIRSHFGVISPDARLQRPEYLGGNSQRMSINPVQQTSSTDATSPQGNLAAYGLATSQSGFTKSFTEHCVILGIVNVRADLTYQQGLPRMFSRRTRWDFYWPALAHLGEQPVYNREIYMSGDSDYDDGIFGYQERWAEYRYFPSQITGIFRSNYPQSLDVWHLSQEFGPTPPELNENFIIDNPPLGRVLAVPSQPQILFDSYFQLHCARPMPVYSVPGLIDHF